MAFINRKKLPLTEIQNHNPLILSPADNGKNWVLMKEYSYAIDHIGSNNTITVPAGFVTDFASIPRIFWTFLPPWGKYGKAAIVHDYLYQTGIRTRKVSDLIFLEIMENSCVNFITSRIIYASVRLFGGFFYNKPCENNQVRNSDFVHQTFTSNSHYGGNLNYKGKSSKARFIIIGGFLGVLIFPFLFTQKWFGDFFNFGSGTGPIGDTIGGLTAPIIGFMSALLVYLAFREQIQANRIQMEAIRKQAEENAFDHEKSLFLDTLKDLKEFMNGSPERFALITIVSLPHESNERVSIIRDLKVQYERVRQLEMAAGKIQDAKHQLIFDFNMLDSNLSKIFISDEDDTNGDYIREQYSRVTPNISYIIGEFSLFLSLFEIIQKHLSLNNIERFHTLRIMFIMLQKLYLDDYSWLHDYIVKKKKFYLGRMMEDDTDNYDRLRDRLVLVEESYSSTKAMIIEREKAYPS